MCFSDAEMLIYEILGKCFSQIFNFEWRANFHNMIFFKFFFLEA